MTDRFAFQVAATDGAARTGVIRMQITLGELGIDAPPRVTAPQMMTAMA